MSQRSLFYTVYRSLYNGPFLMKITNFKQCCRQTTDEQEGYNLPIVFTFYSRHAKNA
jgi:hypothetical protein